jgi:hypothetical protein
MLWGLLLGWRSMPRGLIVRSKVKTGPTTRRGASLRKVGVAPRSKMTPETYWVSLLDITLRLRPLLRMRLLLVVVTPMSVLLLLGSLLLVSMRNIEMMTLLLILIMLLLLPGGLLHRWRRRYHTTAARLKRILSLEMSFMSRF